MEHPLIQNLDSLTIDELSIKINELSKKLAIAHKTGNGYLCEQIRMAIESYQTKYQEKTVALFNKGNNGKNFEDKIDIS